MALGSGVRAKTTLKNASGTTTLFFHILVCFLLYNTGPQTMYTSLYLEAHCLQAFSISFQSPLLSLLF